MPAIFGVKSTPSSSNCRLRRSTVWRRRCGERRFSVSNNVAEGHGRWHYLENIRYCTIARGSTEEIIDGLNACADERYAEEQLLLGLKEQGYQLVRRINGYIRYLKN